MNNSVGLEGKVAVVTGAVQGIGRGIALVLARSGVRIVVGDIQDGSTVVDEIRSLGGEAVKIVMDISQPAQCESLIEFAEKTYGNVDILVNNAAIDAPDGNAWDLTNEEWERTIAVNLGGAFYCSRAALRPMLKTGSGCIINISSQSARHGEKGLSPAYNASKSGLLGLTTALSAQVAEKGVRVNAILPALVESREFGWDSTTREAKIMPYPLGLGRPEDIGQAVLYLASPAARWISGTALHLTGGSQRGSSVF